jgi:formate hydrogenlyase subunit 6/NADH:ubiquinone oxidoreductase subunit I
LFCGVCIEACPTKCLAMDLQYPEPVTARGGLCKVTVAGPKKKEPAPDAAAKPAEKKE